MSVKRIHIRAASFHRNGISGAPFHAAIFDEAGDAAPGQRGRKVGIVFEDRGHVAVLDIAKLAAGDVAFGSNSWRGDAYEPHLRDAIAKHQQSEA